MGKMRQIVSGATLLTATSLGMGLSSYEQGTAYIEESIRCKFSYESQTMDSCEQDARNELALPSLLLGALSLSAAYGAYRGTQKAYYGMISHYVIGAPLKLESIG